MPKVTNEPERVVVSARVKPETVEELTVMRDWINKNVEEVVIGSQSQLLNWLLDQAIDQVRAKMANPQPRELPKLSRNQYAERATAFMDALSDLIERFEREDPTGARTLARGIAKSTTAYSEALDKRYAA